jgi:hypothetical protein
MFLPHRGHSMFLAGQSQFPANALLSSRYSGVEPFQTLVKGSDK